MKKDITARIILALISIAFLTEAYIVSRHFTVPEVPTTVLIVLLGLAAFRLARAVSFNTVGLWIRDICKLETRPDSCGAGDNNHSTGRGVQWVIGELVRCPICSGTWSAMFLITMYAIDKPYGLVLIYELAAAGIAEVLHWLSETLEWGGRHSREQAGKLNRETPAIWNDIPVRNNGHKETIR